MSDVFLSFIMHMLMRENVVLAILVIAVALGTVSE